MYSAAYRRGFQTLAKALGKRNIAVPELPDAPELDAIKSTVADKRFEARLNILRLAMVGQTVEEFGL
jgi:hypothetical protein